MGAIGGPSGPDPEALAIAGALLQALGRPASEEDAPLLLHCARTVEEEIRNACNVPNVPDGLRMCAANLTVEAFLRALLGAGRLDWEGLSPDAGALRALEEGDTKLEWAVDASMSPEGRLKALLDGFGAARAQFAAYRRLRW